MPACLSSKIKFCFVHWLEHLERPDARSKKWAWELLILCGFVLFFRHLAKFDFTHGTVPQDFSVYIKAVQLVSSGTTPYNPADFLTYKYSPGALALFYLLPTDPIQAWLVLKFFYVLFWVVGIGIATVGVGGAGIQRRVWSRLELLKLFIGILLSWKGTIEALDFGQFEFVLLFGAFLSAILLPRRPILSGLLSGSLCWFKLPWGLMMIPVLIVAAQSGRRQLSKALTGIFFAAVLWGGVLPLLLFGPARVQQFSADWIDVLRTQPSYLYFKENANQSLWATVSRMVGGEFSGFVLVAALFAFVGILAIVVCKTWREAQGEHPLAWISRWLLLTLLVNPLSWRWGSLLTVGVPFVLTREKVSQAPKFYGILFCFIVLLILFQQNPFVKFFGVSHWTFFHDYGLITFYWLALLLACCSPQDFFPVRRNKIGTNNLDLGLIRQ